MEALKNGDITPAAFLNRLTFNESKVCDSLADFPDKDLDDWLTEEDETLDVGTPSENDETANQSDIDLTICPACNVHKRECILMPCRHLYFCSPCYQKWSTTNTASFDIVDENLNIIPQTQNDLPEEVKCPICKQTVQFFITPLLA